METLSTSAPERQPVLDEMIVEMLRQSFRFAHYVRNSQTITIDTNSLYKFPKEFLLIPLSVKSLHLGELINLNAWFNGEGIVICPKFFLIKRTENNWVICHQNIVTIVGYRLRSQSTSV